MFSYVVRLISAACVGFAAFYLAIHALDAVGSMDRLTVARVDELYRRILSPLGNLDPIEKRTMVIVLCLIFLQGVLMFVWARKRNYTGDVRLDPLAPAARPSNAVYASASKPNNEVAPVSEAAVRGTVAISEQDEYRRLYRLLKQKYEA